MELESKQVNNLANRAESSLSQLDFSQERDNSLVIASQTGLGKRPQQPTDVDGTAEDSPNDQLAVAFLDVNLTPPDLAAVMPHEFLDNQRREDALKLRNQESVQYYIENPEQLPPELIVALGQYLTLEAATSESSQTNRPFNRYLKEHPEKHSFLHTFIDRIGKTQNRRWIEDKDVVQVVQEGLLKKYELQARNRFLRALDSIMGRDEQILGTLTDKVEDLLASKMTLDREIKSTQTELDALKEKIRTEEHTAHLRALEASKLMLDTHLTEQLKQQEKIEELNRRLGVLQSSQAEKEATYQKNMIDLDTNYHNRHAALEKNFAERETELTKWEQQRLQEIERKQALAEREFRKQKQQYEQEIYSLSIARDKELIKHGIPNQINEIQNFERDKIVTAINERKSNQGLSLSRLKNYEHFLFALEDIGSFEQRFGQLARSETIPTIRVALGSIEPIQRIVGANQIFKIVVGALDNPEISIEEVASLFRENFTDETRDLLNADNFARALQREYPSLFETSADMIWLHDGQFIKRTDFEALTDLASANLIDIETLRTSLRINDGEVESIDIRALNKLQIKDYSSLEKFQNIRHIVLCSQDSETQTHVLSLLSHLDSITIELDKTDNFPSLSPLVNPELIKSLKIETIEFNGDQKEWLSTNLERALKGLPQLESLSINTTDYLPNLNFCNSLKNLKYLRVERLESGGSLDGILSASKLTELHLKNWVKWEDVQKLMDLPHLKVFDGKSDFYFCPADEIRRIQDWQQTVSPDVL